jgi:protein gp37
LHPDRLDMPLRWRKPRRVFVNSMSDLFHDDVPDEYIAEVFAVMAMSPQHTFQVLTKRHGRMRSLLNQTEFWRMVGEHGRGVAFDRVAGKYPTSGPMQLTRESSASGHWETLRPLPNVWLGVSVEDQRWADIRIPALIDTPAAVRFLSCEPLLGPVDLKRAVVVMGDQRGHGLTASWVHGSGCCHRFHGIDWVIVGGESGPGFRAPDPDWIRSIRDQCQKAGVPFFFKQWGGRTPKANGSELDGRTWDEYPEVRGG